MQGMSLVPAVTELMMAELLYLQYDSDIKPINIYINSTGVTVRLSLLLNPHVSWGGAHNKAHRKAHIVMGSSCTWGMHASRIAPSRCCISEPLPPPVCCRQSLGPKC